MKEAEMDGWHPHVYRVDMSFSKLLELVMDAEDWRAVVLGVTKSQT